MIFCSCEKANNLNLESYPIDLGLEDEYAEGVNIQFEN